MNKDIKDIAIEIAKKCDLVKSCIDDDNHLCEILNSVDHKILKEYYNSEKSGPVVDIRKKICEQILLRNINKDKLNEIISNSKADNQSAFRSWTNNFSILNSILVDHLYVDIKNLIDYISNLFENKVKFKVWDFRGARNQGQDHYCLLFYNNTQDSQSSSLQFFIDFKSSKEIIYRVWSESTKSDIDGPYFINIDDFEKIIDYIDIIKDLIINDIKVSKNEISKTDNTFLSAAISVLKSSENLPMSAKEIWTEIEKEGIYKTTGKTPAASLSTIMLGASINSKIKIKSKKLIFECVGDNPIKFKLVNYTPKRIRESLIDDGFITKEMLKEILLKNNINIEI
jgi:hypothetical protein